GTRLPDVVAPAGRDPPRAPREALDAGARVETERVEGALEPEVHARRAGQRCVVRDLPARVAQPVGGTAREPAQQRVERVETVGVEVERQLAACCARPPQGARPRGDETRLRDT